ncbi:MAG: alpha/beta hydrolase-fold protein [Gammaproteobacteria bacterium]
MTTGSGTALAGAMLLLSASPADAERVETGFLDRTVSVDGRSYRYQLYVPSDYSARTRWPVILFLHGAGERGTDGLRQTAIGLGPAIRQDPGRFPAIVVFPQAPPNSQWVGAPAHIALAALERTLEEFHADARRVYLTGISMGGHGTWYLAYRHPERFVALVPICGWIEEREKFPDPVPIVPPEQGPAIRAVALRLAKTPIWIFHGEQDSVVPVSASREIVAALEAISADVRYTEYPDVDHNAWDAAYASEEFTRWLFAQRRP